MSETIAITPNETDRRVDVTVDGEPFTTYLYREDLPVLKKPVLWPIRAASGATVTRGFPIDPRAGERVDHRHHIGHSLTYGAHPGVNGVDFWGTSDDIDPDEETEKGLIRHREIDHADGGDGRGELAVTMDWERGDGRRILREETTFRFLADGDRRAVDRTSTLTAVDGPASFPDDKEGMFAVRVAPGLEHPSEDTITVLDEDGDTVEVPGDEGRHGEYLSSDGVRGLDVWGTRAAWMRLSGEAEGEAVSVTIMDHPDNVGHPTYWHARGYGLFSANPLGQAIFSDGAEELDFELGAGESTTFRHRLAVDLGTPSADELDERYEAFADER